MPRVWKAQFRCEVWWPCMTKSNLSPKRIFSDSMTGKGRSRRTAPQQPQVVVADQLDQGAAGGELGPDAVDVAPAGHDAFEREAGQFLDIAVEDQGEISPPDSGAAAPPGTVRRFF